MTPSNDVLVSDALLEDKSVTIWPDYPCLYDVWSVDFRNFMHVPIYYLPRLSVRHGTDGIARIKNILKYYILMSVVLYILNDKLWSQMYTYI